MKEAETRDLRSGSELASEAAVERECPASRANVGPTQSRVSAGGCIALGWIGFALALAACGGQAQRETEDGRHVPPICDGAIGGEPTVLTSGLLAAALHADGEHLIVVEREGRVLRVDRCTGDAEQLAESQGSIISSAVTRDHVFVKAELGDMDDRTPLYRISKRDNQLRNVSEDLYSRRMFADETALYYDTGSDVFALDGSALEARLLASLPAPPPEGWRTFQGVGSGGLYFTSSYTGTPDSLLRLPFEMDELVGVPGAEAGPGPSGWGLSVAGPDLYLMARGGDSAGELVRLPLIGGQAESLLEPTDAGDVNRSMMRASTQGVCWLENERDETSWTIEDATLLCLPLEDPKRGLRAIVRIEIAKALTVAENGVYWLQPADDQTYQLMAAAL